MSAELPSPWSPGVGVAERFGPEALRLFESAPVDEFGGREAAQHLAPAGVVIGVREDLEVSAGCSWLL